MKMDKLNLLGLCEYGGSNAGTTYGSDTDRSQMGLDMEIYRPNMDVRNHMSMSSNISPSSS